MSQSPGLLIAGQATLNCGLLFAPMSLDLPAGQWTCLLGGSGVGKSTVLRLISGLPTEATFSGQISATDGQPVADRVAYMAQDDLLMPWASVEENVLLGARLRAETPDRTRAKHVLDRVGLSAHTTKKPSELSGGQRQRVALARTLMEDKPVILLDEPFSALDAQTRAEMQEMTAELLQGRTVLLVTHDPAEAARLGHQIAIMTQQNLQICPPPAATPPRAVSDAEVLQTQADLLSLLRKS